MGNTVDSSVFSKTYKEAYDIIMAVQAPLDSRKKRTKKFKYKSQYGFYYHDELKALFCQGGTSWLGNIHVKNDGL